MRLLRHNVYKGAIILFLAFPSLSRAQAIRAPRDFKGFVGILTDIMETLVILIFALTFIVFMWGLVKSWIIKGGDSEGVEEGKKIAVTGIIVLVVMTTFWGILNLLKSSLF